MVWLKKLDIAQEILDLALSLPSFIFFFALHYQAGISKPSCSAHLHKSVQVHHEFESNLPCLSRATLQIAVISFFPYILHELAGLFLVFLCHTAMCRIVFLSVRLCNNSAWDIQIYKPQLLSLRTCCTNLKKYCLTSAPDSPICETRRVPTLL